MAAELARGPGLLDHIPDSPDARGLLEAIKKKFNIPAAAAGGPRAVFIMAPAHLAASFERVRACLIWVSYLFLTDNCEETMQGASGGWRQSICVWLVVFGLCVQDVGSARRHHSQTTVATMSCSVLP